MINSINPINNSATAAFSAYGQAQNVAKQAAQIVFSSLETLSGSQDGAISFEELKKIKTLIEESSATKSSAYGLVNTMSARFDALSSDGKNITQDDFVSAIKFSVAQGFKQTTNLYQALRPDTSVFSQNLVKKYGMENLQVLDLIQIMDSLSGETVNKMIYNLKNKDNNSNSQNTTKNTIQDYKTVTKEQLKFPINIGV